MNPVEWLNLFPMQNLQTHEWLALAPIALVGFGSIVALILSLLKGNFGRFASMAAVNTSLALALLLLIAFQSKEAISITGGIIYVNETSIYLSCVLAAISLFTSQFSLGFADKRRLPGEFFALIGLACVGMMLMVSTKHLVMFFIALEFMSLSLYTLIAMQRHVPAAADASIKYFIIGGVGGAMFLYGATLIYGTSGSLAADQIREAYTTLWQQKLPMMTMAGLGLIAVAFLFKLGAFPFQFWIPDVYAASQAPISGFMITAVKAAAFGALIQIGGDLFALDQLFVKSQLPYAIFFALIAVTILVGSLSGLGQLSLKRMLACSTISHTGFLLLGFLAAQGGTFPEAYSAMCSYLLFYAVMNLGAFTVLSMMEASRSEQHDLQINELSGLFYRSPIQAIALCAFLLSLAGIPPTIGFLGKFSLFKAAWASGEQALTLIAILGSLISIAFYLKPIALMFMQDNTDTEAQEAKNATLALSPNFLQEKPWFGAQAVMVLMLILTLAMGIFPRTFGL